MAIACLYTEKYSKPSQLSTTNNGCVHVDHLHTYYRSTDTQTKGSRTCVRRILYMILFLQQHVVYGSLIVGIIVVSCFHVFGQTTHVVSEICRHGQRYSCKMLLY